MSRYKQQENEPSIDTELDSWPEGGNVRVYSPTYKRMIPRANVLSVLAMAIILSLSFGVLIGYFGHAVHHPEDHCYSDTLVRLTAEAHDKITDEIISETKSINIKNYLEKLSNKVHLAGTERQKVLAEYLYDEWTKAGLDHVRLDPYDVLLNYPDTKKPNQISIVDNLGNVLWVSTATEKALRYDEMGPDIVPPFNAFSASGTVLSDLVYVNYGTIDDFIKLVTVFDVPLEGKIAIARYGRNFRGDKVENAERFNMSGIIIFTDPYDAAPQGYTDTQTFPNSWWMPDSGVQRGTVSELNGDSLTIGYPSNPYMYRELPTKNALPNIPSYPISYGDAVHLLRSLDGPEVPENWKGSLNITYRLGPGFKINDKVWKVKLEVNLKHERRMIYNVIGRINGSLEPDRYVILGNHRDSWTFGAVDPSSGTACLCETARVLGRLHSLSNWKPRRTIIFASWDAEEYTLIGSVEYVENNIRLLKERAIAYLNVDVSVSGNHSIRIKGSPLLYQASYDVAKMIPNPNLEEVSAGRKTVYDTWLWDSLRRKRAFNLSFLTTPSDLSGVKEYESTPYISDLGAGSDFVPFVNLAGVSSLDIRYDYDKIGMPIGNYPLYHTRHDTFFLMSEYIDPGFNYHRAVSQYWSEMARYLADSYTLPYLPSHYGHALRRFIHNVYQKYQTTILMHDISLDILSKAITDFQTSASDFEYANREILQNNNAIPTTHNAHSNPSVNPRADPLRIRAFNDKLVSIERGFLDCNGLPHKPWYKHLVMAPSSFNFYSGSGFPALDDLLWILQMFSEFMNNHKSISLEAFQKTSNATINNLMAYSSVLFGSLNTVTLSHPAYYKLALNETTKDRENILYYSNEFSFKQPNNNIKRNRSPLMNDQEMASLDRAALERASLDFENPAPFESDVRSQKIRLANKMFQHTYNSFLADVHDMLERHDYVNLLQNKRNVPPQLAAPSSTSLKFLIGQPKAESVNILVQAIKKHVTVLAYTIKSTAAIFED